MARNRSSPNKVDSPPVKTTRFAFFFRLNRSIAFCICSKLSLCFKPGLQFIKQWEHFAVHPSVVTKLKTPSLKGMMFIFRFYLYFFFATAFLATVFTAFLTACLTVFGALLLAALIKFLTCCSAVAAAFFSALVAFAGKDFLIP